MLLRLLFPILLAATSTVVTAAPALTTSADPSLKVTTLDGTTFDLAAQRGKWVIVNFWATWCSPCIKEMPELSAFDAKHANVVAIGLDFEDIERKDLDAFLARHPVHYPIAQIDPIAPPPGIDPPRGLPTTWLIAPDGSVAQKFVGPVTVHDLARAIGVAP